METYEQAYERIVKGAKAEANPVVASRVSRALAAVGKAATAKEPYGNVTYADPGLQDDGKKRYPLDTEEHIRAAWGYINQDDNKALYSDADYKKVRGAIAAAMKKIGAEVED